MNHRPKTRKGRLPFRDVLVASLLLIFAFVALTAAKPEDFVAKVVSSAADQVTGGDARLHVHVPTSLQDIEKIQVLVNGDNQRDRFELMTGTRILTGVIHGLNVGDNAVRVEVSGSSSSRRNGKLGKGRKAGSGRKSTTLTLKNHPITGPVFSGPHQHPFICSVQRHLGRQPLVDSVKPPGTKVLDESGSIAGYSRNCSIKTFVEYFYKSTKSSATNTVWKTYVSGENRTDIEQTTTSDGKNVDFIVRWERGTINRFIYSIAVLAPEFNAGPDDVDRTAWNGKLLHYFQGGTDFGHTQGRISGSRARYEHALAKGYGLTYSTGTRTSTHYNLVLGGETALMVKERFIEVYEVPYFTLGIGRSGGAIQQYVYAQNHKGLFDGLIPMYSYPDMVTQIPHVFDCNLLEYYMDTLDGANAKWGRPTELPNSSGNWENRRLLEGFSASNIIPNLVASLYSRRTGGQPVLYGSTECGNEWRATHAVMLNPHYGTVDDEDLYVPQEDVENMNRSHFDDMVNIYGINKENGYANNLWDNVGVQYGLRAVASGQITPAEFMHVNSAIGGWKDEPNMVQEGSPFYPEPFDFDKDNWDPWGARNQFFGTRTRGDLEAMRAAYERGMVFLGDIDIPILDWRHYLDMLLDKHGAYQSFAARARIQSSRGHSDNHLIWITLVPFSDDEKTRFDQRPQLLHVMDEWLTNIRVNPELGVAGNKPAMATDGCFDITGDRLYMGPNVWDGVIDKSQTLGSCVDFFKNVLPVIFPVFPTGGAEIYSTSRIEAGGPFTGSIFKCHLKSVSKAIKDGDYGTWVPSKSEKAMLELIFPEGVCDFSKPDRGLSRSKSE